MFFYFNIIDVLITKKNLKIRVDYKTFMISVLLMFVSFLKIFTGKENEFIYFAF